MTLSRQRRNKYKACFTSFRSFKHCFSAITRCLLPIYGIATFSGGTCSTTVFTSRRRSGSQRAFFGYSGPFSTTSTFWTAAFWSAGRHYSRNLTRFRFITHSRPTNHALHGYSSFGTSRRRSHPVRFTTTCLFSTSCLAATFANFCQSGTIAFSQRRGHKNRLTYNRS